MFNFSPILAKFVGKYDQILVIESKALQPIGVCDYPTLWLEDGEENKCLTQVEKIWDFLLAQNATRQSLLVNVGGGTITDMGGFAAATYKRGIHFVNIPTTILSMVDASWGGKTGFDYGEIKNSVGVFHQPVETIVDTRWLSSLPLEQVLCGYAEMLKHGLIADKTYWKALLNYDPSQEPNNETMRQLIEQSIGIKQLIVSQDPTEQGPRQALNYGHTIGHALELPPINHGYAVLYGMIAESYISHVLLGLDKEVVTQLVHLMNTYYGKPQCDCKQADALIERMHQDKKNTDKQNLRFTLLKAIGQPVWGQVVDERLVRESLDYLFSV